MFKQKSVLLCLVLFLFVLALPLNLIAKIEKGFHLYSWIDKPRIRKKPGLKGKAIGYLGDREMVYFIQKSKLKARVKLRGKNFYTPFYQIKRKNGQIGWVYAGALKKYNLSLEIILKSLPKESLLIVKYKGVYGQYADCVADNHLVINPEKNRIEFQGHGVLFFSYSKCL